MPTCRPETIQIKAGNHYQLRSFSIADAEALQNFFYQSSLESHHTLHYKEKKIPLMKLQEKIKGAEECSSEIFIGIFDNEKIIGQLYFRTSHPEHPWIKHIGEFGMTILKDYWGQGIGSELLKHMESFAISINILRIEAKARVANERAMALYKKFGYKIEGIRKNAAFIEGSFQDEFFIAKILPSI